MKSIGRRAGMCCMNIALITSLYACTNVAGDPYRNVLLNQSFEADVAYCRYSGNQFMGNDTEAIEQTCVEYSRKYESMRVERIDYRSVSGCKRSIEIYKGGWVYSWNDGDTVCFRRRFALRTLNPIASMAPLLRRTCREGTYLGQTVLDGTTVSVYKIAIDVEENHQRSEVTVAFDSSGMPRRIEQYYPNVLTNPDGGATNETLPFRMIKYPMIYNGTETESRYNPVIAMTICER